MKLCILKLDSRQRLDFDWFIHSVAKVFNSNCNCSCRSLFSFQTGLAMFSWAILGWILIKTSRLNLKQAFYYWEISTYFGILTTYFTVFDYIKITYFAQKVYMKFRPLLMSKDETRGKKKKLNNKWICVFLNCYLFHFQSTLTCYKLMGHFLPTRDIQRRLIFLLHCDIVVIIQIS